MAALLDFSSKVGKETSLLKKAIQINNEIQNLIIKTRSERKRSKRKLRI